MGLTLRVVDKKYYNSFINDSNFLLNLGTFDTNLAGTVMESSKVEFTLEVGWSSSTTDTWTITSRGGTSYEINRATGSFITDGWATGNKFDYFDTFTTAPTLVDTGLIDFISDDGSYMFVTIATSIVGVKTDNGIRANAGDVENQLNSLTYFPNLIENDDTFSTASLQNGTEGSWYSDGIQSVIPVEMIARGTNRSFVTGNVFINNEGAVGDYFQSFKITHTYIIVPYYFEGDDFTVAPDFLAGSASLKYVFKADFRKALSDIGSSKVLTFENNRGTVGYFNETITGGTPSYTATIDYDRLSVQNEVTATITVKGTFNAQTKYSLLFSYLPTTAEYNSNATFDTTFDYTFQSAFAFVSSSFASYIKNLSSSLNGAGDLVITVVFDKFTSYSSSDKYLLALMIGNTANHRDRAILTLDKNNFKSETANNGLITITSNHLDYHGSLGDKTYIEDGLSIQFDMNLDLNKQAVLKSLSAKLVATNGTTTFELDSYNFILPNLVIGGVQQLDSLAFRGYLISPTSEYNVITLLTGENTGGIQSYSGKLAQKISWQDWISNPAVAEVFFDNTKLNNNLNYKASNYSLKEGYDVKMLFVAVVEGEDIYGAITSQTYELFQDAITVYDYLEDGKPIPKIIPTVQTFINGVDSSLRISSEEDTLFRITWDLEDDVTFFEGSTGVHRIELFHQNGTSMYELSSYDTSIRNINSPLKGIDGDFVKFYIDNGNLVTECLIDYNKIQPTTRYSLSGRITKI